MSLFRISSSNRKTNMKPDTISIITIMMPKSSSNLRASPMTHKKISIAKRHGAGKSFRSFRPASSFRLKWHDVKKGSLRAHQIVLRRSLSKLQWAYRRIHRLVGEGHCSAWHVRISLNRIAFQVAVISLSLAIVAKQWRSRTSFHPKRTRMLYNRTMT